MAKRIKPPVIERYLCDQNRHLICLPYSQEHMKQLGAELVLKRRYLSKIEGKRFYRIPFDRVDEIENRAEVVPACRILQIITGHE